MHDILKFVQALTMGRIIIYTKQMAQMIEFYSHHFSYEHYRIPNDRIVELRPKSTGVIILLHPASKGQKEGQALVKLVFDIKDVEKFCTDAKEKGLKFGPVHQANGYVFANAKDPSNNSISVSSRAFFIPLS